MRFWIGLTNATGADRDRRNGDQLYAQVDVRVNDDSRTEVSSGVVFLGGPEQRPVGVQFEANASDDITMVFSLVTAAHLSHADLAKVFQGARDWLFSAAKDELSHGDIFGAIGLGVGAAFAEFGFLANVDCDGPIAADAFHYTGEYLADQLSDPDLPILTRGELVGGPGEPGVPAWWDGQRVDVDHHYNLTSPDGCGDPSYDVTISICACGEFRDPMPRLLAQGHWSTIQHGHRLVRLYDTALDWEPATGHFRIWRVATRLAANVGEEFADIAAGLPFDTDPLPGDVPLHEGDFEPFKHASIVPLRADGDGDTLLLYYGDGGHAVVDYLRDAGPRDIKIGTPPFSELCYQNAGSDDAWVTIDDAHQLMVFDIGQTYAPVEAPGYRAVLDVSPTGDARVWKVAGLAEPRPTYGDPFPGNPITSCHWPTIDGSHRLAAQLYGVLDWVPKDGSYRFWVFSADARGSDDPLPGNPINQGYWPTIAERTVADDTHAQQTEILAWGGGSDFLEWHPDTGRYWLWGS